MHFSTLSQPGGPKRLGNSKLTAQHRHVISNSESIW